MPSSLRNRAPLGAASVAVALLALVAARPAAACSCAAELEPDVAVEGADVIFEGQPTEVKPLQVDLGFGDYQGAKRFRFDVARYFKAQLGPSVPIFTVDQSSACGREYALGQTYVIYARYTDEGLLTDFACSRSRHLDAAEDDLALLGAGLTPDASYPEDLDTASPAADGTAAPSSGIRRLPLPSDEAPRGCASLAPTGAARGWPGLALLLGAIAALAATRTRSLRAP